MSDETVFINPWKLWHGAYVPEWLMRRHEPSAGAKLAYARLCRFASKDAVARPTIGELAEELGVEERQARRYTSELAKLNLVDIEQRGLGLPNLYRFRAHRWMGLDGTDTYDPSGTDICDRTGTDMDDRSGTDGYDRADRSHVSVPSSNSQSQLLSHADQGVDSVAAEGKGDQFLRRAELTDALVEATGHRPITASERSGLNRCVRELITANATGDDVRARATAYRSSYPNAVMTSAALVRHWGELDGTNPTSHTTTSQSPARDCEHCDSTGWLIGLIPGAGSTRCTCNPDRSLEVVR